MNTEQADKMNKSYKWRVIGESVRGASHIRKYLPNQDAIKWYSDSESGLPLILAVSDGHGSKKSFRSDRGAKFAVDIAVSTIKEFIKAVNPHEKVCNQKDYTENISNIWDALIREQKQAENLTIPKRIAEEQLPKEIVKKWKEEVKADIQKDLEGFQNLQGLNEIAYGATLLSVLITESFIICLQLGDGDILVLCEDGDVQRVVPKDDRLFANETTSLCAKDSWRDFRFFFQPILNKPPKLILTATDGYANSFKDDESFFKVASDMFQMITSEGAEFVEKNLESWLNEASERGSGDDISVGIILLGRP